MKKYLGVVGHKELIREEDSRGIINIDNASLENYKKEREYKLKLNKVIEEHDSIKQDIADIKKLLLEFLGKT